MADRKTEILEATCRVIAREGADGLRMGTVAREAGVSSALLHYYFDTRADLLMQAFDHADVKADQAAEAALAGIPGAVERLRRLLEIYAGADAVFRDDWVLWVEMWRSAIFDERLAESVRRSSASWIEQITDLTGAGARRGIDRRRDRHHRCGDAAGRDGGRAGPADPVRHHQPRARRGADQKRAGDRAGPSHNCKERRMSVVRRHEGQDTAGAGLHVARGVRGGDARGVPEVVELRLPRQRRGGAGEVLDDHDRRRAGRRAARQGRAAARALERLPAPRGPHPGPARAAARRCCAAPTTAGRTARTASWRPCPRRAASTTSTARACRLPAVPGGRAERAGVRLHERGDRAAGHLLRRPGREAGAAAAGRAAGRPAARERLRPQLEGDRRQLPGGLPHPGRPSRPAAAARLQALRRHARPRTTPGSTGRSATSRRATTRSGSTRSCCGR